MWSVHSSCLKIKLKMATPPVWWSAWRWPLHLSEDQPEDGHSTCLKISLKMATPSVWRSAWRWPLHLSDDQPEDGPTNWVETCRWNYNLIQYKIVSDCICISYYIVSYIQHKGMCDLRKKWMRINNWRNDSDGGQNGITRTKRNNSDKSGITRTTTE